MSKISLALSSWYKMQNYNFPWREKKTVYSIWISEIMLQQTQVNTASSYFKSWMKKFSSVDKVASANIDTVLKLWEGLEGKDLASKVSCKKAYKWREKSFI